MERITKELSLEEILAALDALQTSGQRLNNADFTFCNMKHERLVFDECGRVKVAANGKFLSGVCQLEVTNRRFACPHHYEKDTPIISTALRRIISVTNDIALPAIQQ